MAIRLSRRSLVQSGGAGGLALLMVACGGSAGGATSAAPTPNKGPVQITLAHWQKVSVAHQAQDAAVERLKQKQPNITVMEEVGSFDDFYEKLLIQHTAGTPPDVTASSTAGFALMAKNGVYLDLGKLLSADKAFKKEDYFPAGFQMFTWDGKLQAAPATLNAYLFYYNKTLLQRSGAPVPQANWTFAQFQEGITRTIRPEAPTWGFTGGVAQFYHALMLTDGQLFDDKMAAYLGDKSAGAGRALAFWGDLFAKQRPAIAAASSGGGDPFLAGRAAFTVGTRNYTGTITKAQVPFEWDVALPPKWDQSAAMYGGSAYAASSKSKQPDAAWQLLRELVGEDGAKLYAEAGGDIPWLVRVAKAMVPPPPSAGVFIDAMNILAYRFGSPPGKAFPLPPATREIQSDAVEPLVKEVQDGTKTAQQASQEMRSRAEPILARYR